jgi:transcriptional regulator with XRE-family HTH domain
MPSRIAPSAVEFSLRLLGDAVRDLRNARSLTQQELADLCGFNRTFIVAVEKGRQNCSMMSLIKLAKALQVTPADLFCAFTPAVMRRIAM